MSSDLITSGGAVTRPTKNAGAASAAIAELREQGANVLVAASLVEDLPPDHRLMIRKLEFDAARDFYPTGGERYAPSKRVLEQISSALGVQWRPDLCRRLDNGQPNVSSFKAVAVAPDPATGQPRMFEATYELDLRDGSALHEEHVEKLEAAKAEAAGNSRLAWKPGNEIKAFRLRRRHVVALADTGARLRVIRQIAPVRSDYTKQEISKPFVTVTMVYQPGIDDPETRRIVAERAAQARIAMYYGGALAQGEPVAAPGTPAPLPPQPPAPVASLDVDEVNEAFRALEQPTTAPVDPLADVPAEALVWCDNAGKVERYPKPDALASAPRAARVFVVRAILEATSYDYAGAMAKAGKSGTPVESLPDSWLGKLYESAHKKLAILYDVDVEVVFAEFDDDDIPFD